MMSDYNLGGLNVRWESDFPLLSGPFLDQFCADFAVPDITLTGEISPLAPLLKSPCLSEGPVFDRYDLDGEPVLVYHWGQLRNGFAIFPRRIGPKGGSGCIFDPEMTRQPPLHADWFLGLSGLHRALLLQDAPILHAACVEHQGQAILFAAPSQTGKSTQAELWRIHAGAEIVNGDRIALRRKDGRWHAWGYPCCGSSGICRNRTLPIRAVVALAQSPDDRVEQMTPGQQLRALSAGMQLYSWMADEVDTALRLAGQLAGDIPVIRLLCTPTQKAVEALRQYLEVNGL